MPDAAIDEEISHVVLAWAERRPRSRTERLTARGVAAELEAHTASTGYEKATTVDRLAEQVVIPAIKRLRRAGFIEVAEDATTVLGVTPAGTVAGAG